MHAWLSFLSHLSLSSAKRGHRQVIMLSGPLHWSWPLLAPWLAQHDNNGIISRHIPPGINGQPLATNKPSNLLGYESDQLVFNCHEGLYPDALTAIAGTLTCGGILFMLCPDTQAWPQYTDDFAQQRAPHTAQAMPAPNNDHMIRRLLDQARQHDITIIKPDTELPQIPPVNLGNNPANNPEKAWRAATTLSADQMQVYEAICEHLKDSQYLHVITADRGRGKSHLLGKLLLQAMDANIDNGIKFYLTAPNKAACRAIYKALGPAVRTQRITFIAPEEVLTTVGRDDVLLVDEAASLAINLLIQYSEHMGKLIMATTTHGYEGTGKGFQVRFLRHLNSQAATSSVYYHTLSSPIRYAQSDPLERWLFATFCLNSEPRGLTLSPQQVVTPVMRLVDQQQLATDNALLEEIFGLLIQAHYQTRPSDLRDILDAPDFKLFVLFNGDRQARVLAACLISKEGPMLGQPTDKPGIELPLHRDIFNGLRRPRGHLMPQVLAHHMGLVQALALKGARIIRIATLPNLQQQQLGSSLLTAVGQHLKRHQYDYLGSSYADSHDVRGFWLKNGFRRVRVGNKRDAASGTYSALTLQGLSPRGIELAHAAEAGFLRSTKKITNMAALNENERRMLNAFLTQRGSYEHAKQLLTRCQGWQLPFPKKASKEFKEKVARWLQQQA